MLHLAADTSPTWVAHVNADVDTLLLDHAHCEKKAASTAMNLIFRYGDKPELLRALTAIAKEELEHFELLMDVLERRGKVVERLSPSLYAGRLMTAVRKTEPERLCDTLLCCALIEARSCERMKRLSEGLDDLDLRELYRSLLASEARHFQVYVDLARKLVPTEDVSTRLRELAEHEASTLVGEDEPVRMHSAVAS